MSVNGSFLDKNGLTYLWSKLKAIEAEDRAALTEALDSGAKNLLDILGAQHYRTGQETDFPITVGGVTFSENGGVLNASGTATSTLTLRAPVNLRVGTYFVSGCPDGGSDSSYRIDLREQGTNTLIGSERDYESGFGFLISEDRTIDLCIRISTGYNATGLIFKPMVCSFAAYKISPAFVPYAPTNAELYEMIKSLQSQLS